MKCSEFDDSEHLSLSRNQCLGLRLEMKFGRRTLGRSTPDMTRGTASPDCRVSRPGVVLNGGSTSGAAERTGSPRQVVSGESTVFTLRRTCTACS